jgi:hypothetical protein
MYILNVTYVLADTKVALWKKWLKESALAQNDVPDLSSIQVFKINHVAEAGQVSFAVQYPFGDLDRLDRFEAMLDNEHASSLAPIFGPQCLFFTTVLSKEEI